MRRTSHFFYIEHIAGLNHSFLCELQLFGPREGEKHLK